MSQEESSIEKENQSASSPEETVKESSPLLNDEELAKAAAEVEKAAAAPAEKTPEEKLEEMRNNYLRALAENENYRKRVAREMQDIRENTRMSTIGEVVGIYDLLQMAVKAADTAKDISTLQQGIQMTFGQFKHTLQNMNVEVIDALGTKFDPQQHEAISTIPSEDIPEGEVVQQWQVGFRIGKKLLRPARVIVSAGPAKTAETAADERAAESAKEE